MEKSVFCKIKSKIGVLIEWGHNFVGEDKLQLLGQTPCADSFGLYIKGLVKLTQTVSDCKNCTAALLLKVSLTDVVKSHKFYIVRVWGPHHHPSFLQPTLTFKM